MNSTDAASLYIALQAQFPTDRWTQPLALAAHREALRAIDLNAETYPETFCYRDEGIEEYLAGLADVEQVVSACKDLGRVADRVAEQVRRDRLAATTMKARHDPTFSAAQRELHGIPPQALVSRAKHALCTNTSEQEPMEPTTTESVTVDALAERMVNALRSYGLAKWYVEIEANMAAKASVNGAMQRVRLRSGEIFSAVDADRLILHEIGGHVLRWANSRRQPEPWAKVPMGRTVPTEEGLAVCLESAWGFLDRTLVRKYQVRCLAVSVAAQGGIMDVMRAISPYVDRDDAVEIAIRTKRGLLDPNAPGGATKDWGYYDGFLRMRELHASNPADYHLLGGVKWPVEDIPLIKELLAEGRLGEPVLVPDRARLGLAEQMGYDAHELREST